MKKPYVMIASALLALARAVSTSAQEVDEFSSTVRSVYGFEPHTLTDAQISAKSDEMDKFWGLVKSDTSRYLPLLRQALGDATNPSFFAYDGSKLLLSLSNRPEDRQLALRAIPRCDLRDVQPKDYLYTVFSFAREGRDTADAAFKILSDDQFRVIVPEHALTLGQDFSFMYLLLPLPESMYLDRAIAALDSERNPTSQKSLLRLLWYTVTEAGDQAIVKVSGSDAHPAEVRDLAKQLLLTSETLQKDAKPPKELIKAVSEFLPKDADPARIREVRRSRLSRISDEALEELDSLTWLLRIRDSHPLPSGPR